MLLRGYSLRETADFRGPWTQINRNASLGARRGLFARNVIYVPGKVQTRDAFSAKYASAKTWSMCHWFNESINRLLILDSAPIVQDRNVISGTLTGLYSAHIDARGLYIAEAGDRLFFSTFTATPGQGVDRLLVWDPVSNALDLAFGGTSSLAPSYAEIGAGNLSSGGHIAGYIVETRSGFLGKANPQNGVGQYVGFPLNPSGPDKLWRATLGPFNVPTDWVKIHPIITTGQNIYKHFFIGDPIPVVGGAVGATYQWDLNESDASLEENARSADMHLDLYAQNTSGNGPFNPTWLAPYGDRLVIFDGNAKQIFVSERFDYQTITLADHRLELPGNRLPITGGQLRGAFYVLGRAYTYAYEDNNGLPSTWRSPREVSSALGTPAPYGIEWRTQGDYWWVASQSGLFLFNGAYTDKPISYYQSTWWNQINWAQAHRIKVRDWTDRNMVLVAVPLNSATECSHIFVWSYARGLSPEQVDFSVWDIANERTFGTIELFIDESKLPKLLIGPSAASSNILVNLGLSSQGYDELIFSPSSYETGYLDTRNIGGRKRVQIGALEMMVTGLGTMRRTLYGVDRKKSLQLPDLVLDIPDLNPGYAYRNQPYMIDENFTLKIEMTAPVAWGAFGYFVLERIGLYVKPYADRIGI